MEDYATVRDGRFHIISVIENEFNLVCTSDTIGLEFVCLLRQEAFSIPVWFAEMIVNKVSNIKNGA